MIEELKRIVAEEKDEIRRQYKAQIQIKAVFGSYARGDFHADSDLDLLVDVDAGATLLDLVGLQQFLEDRLGCKVDLGTESSLREDIRASVFSEMIRLS
jgi:predicted nucleotidyltransferase